MLFKKLKLSLCRWISNWPFSTHLFGAIHFVLNIFYLAPNLFKCLKTKTLFLGLNLILNLRFLVWLLDPIVIIERAWHHAYKPAMTCNFSGNPSTIISNNNPALLHAPGNPAWARGYSAHSHRQASSPGSHLSPGSLQCGATVRMKHKLSLNNRQII